MRFTDSFSRGNILVSGLCGFGARRVADTGKVVDSAQSHTVLSSVKNEFSCPVAILRVLQLSSCFAFSVSLASRARSVAFLPRFVSLRNSDRWCAQDLGSSSAVLRGSGIHLGTLLRRRGVESGDVRRRRMLGCRKQPRNPVLHGTPQMYFLFVVDGRSAVSSNCSVVHGGAPEYDRSAACIQQ